MLLFKKFSKAISLFLSVFGLFIVPLDIQADGCFFYDVNYMGNPPESPSQRAVIFHDGVEETLILQVKYHGAAQNFSWVIPLPSLPKAEDIETTDDARFNELYQRTQPRIYYSHAKQYGRGKGVGSAGENYGDDTVVKVWQQLNVGPYAVAVISGASSTALVDWLTENGYALPGLATNIIDFYVQKKWYFVAIKVSLEPEGQSPSSSFQAGLPALKLTFATTKPVFPLRISELTAARESEIQLYVIAKHRVVCENYRTAAVEVAEVQRLAEQEHGSKTGVACACKRITGYDFDYESYFHDKVQAYSQPTFLVEHASSIWRWDFDGAFAISIGDDEPYRLTRLGTILPKSAMADDVLFVPDQRGNEWLLIRVFIEEEPSWAWLGAGIGAFFGIFWLPIGPVRQFRRRYGVGLLLFVLLALIAMG